MIPGSVSLSITDAGDIESQQMCLFDHTDAILLGSDVSQMMKRRRKWPQFDRGTPFSGSVPVPASRAPRSAWDVEYSPPAQHFFLLFL